jgi:peptide/nickel transport system permease protein
VLPVLCLTISGFLLSGVVRFVRSGMLDALGADYVRMARAKGLHERAVNWRHAFPNAAIPLVTFTGFYIVLLVGGASLVVETVFAWPGIGTLLSQAIVSRDYPIVQAVAVIYVGVSIVSNLVVDLLYGYLDPRIRY